MFFSGIVKLYINIGLVQTFLVFIFNRGYIGRAAMRKKGLGRNLRAHLTPPTALFGYFLALQNLPAKYRPPANIPKKRPAEEVAVQRFNLWDKSLGFLNSLKLQNTAL